MYTKVALCARCHGDRRQRRRALVAILVVHGFEVAGVLLAIPGA
jgi:cytochrome c553